MVSSTAGLMLACLAFAKACVSPAQQPLITPCAAVTAAVDRHVDSATCRLRPTAGSGAGLGSGSGTVLAEVAGVEMTLAPRRPAAAKTTITELLRWQPYGIRVDADAERLRYVCSTVFVCALLQCDAGAYHAHTSLFVHSCVERKCLMWGICASVRTATSMSPMRANYIPGVVSGQRFRHDGGSAATEHAAGCAATGVSAAGTCGR